MPRYFFDTTNGDQFLPDRDGHELENDDQARFEALDALPDMARDTMPDGDRRTFRSSVRDETGHVIYEASLMLEGRWNIRVPDEAEQARINSWAVHTSRKLKSSS